VPAGTDVLAVQGPDRVTNERKPICQPGFVGCLTFSLLPVAPAALSRLECDIGSLRNGQLRGGSL